MKENNFDFLRHFFAFSVIWHHFIFLTGYQVTFLPLEILNSDIGVKGFFIISGLLIWLSAEHTKCWRTFFIKRLFRIYPALIGVLVLSSFVAFLYFEQPLNIVVDYFLWNSIFLNFMSHCIGDMFIDNEICAVNGSLWTLKLEVAYYIFVGVVVFTLRAFAFKILVVVTIISFFLDLSLSLLPENYSNLVLLIHNQIPFKFYYFGSGVILYRFHEKIPNNIMCFTLLVGFIGWFIFDIKFIFLPLFVLSLVFFVAFRLPVVNFSKYGDLSYGMYIFHFPIIQFFSSENLFFGVFFLDFFLILILVLVMSKLSWELIEKKSIKFARSLSENIKL